MITYNNFLNEKYGANDLVKKIKDEIILLINNDIEGLIQNQILDLKDKLSKIDNFNFKNTFIRIKTSNREYGNIVYEFLTIEKIDKNYEINNKIQHCEI